MDSLATFSLVSVLIIFISPVSTDQSNITAESGQDIILPCRAPDSKPVTAVKWTRTDLGSEYVFLYRDDQISLENQHPSYKNRVDLQETQMKDGDVSLVLKNVTTVDRGTYECRFFQKETSTSMKTILIINLDVFPPPGELVTVFSFSLVVQVRVTHLRNSEYVNPEFGKTLGFQKEG
ncbi:hypothetical protein ATANTOWER_018018 [Ataeniobius toweri]|uniref:Ig-like domain-containing protein n=1 Tax=Ataeniobius toweri TaxID=208326 RepID=A0ABU7BTE7_9TELE|nr:hypothetical protein [Ataeniobius toweri]